MNNALIIKAKTLDEAIDKASAGNDMVEISTTLKHLSTLRGTIHFQKYVNTFIIPEINRKIKSLKTEKNIEEIRHIQGYIEGLEKFIDIDKFEKNYKLKLEQHGKEQRNGRK